LPENAEGRVDLETLIRALGGMGVASAVVEGGAGLITGFLRARLVDRLAVCIAPRVLGSGIEAVGDLGVRELSESLILTGTAVIPYGVDLILDSHVEYPNGSSESRR
jgi:5-amino-6-(5-phosphoribosylamino)uracil reductase/diaminohydroxyphosphoribosylaminopyrimidine deaminase/5-amino-6-(5-phosphoribosylamino)uracil reductase